MSKIPKDKALGCALRLVRQYVDVSARIVNDAVEYSHFRGEFKHGMPVKTTRRMTVGQCRQLTEEMSL